MNIRHYLPKVIAIAVLAAANSCFGTVLSVTQHNQEEDQWCWAASSQMILEYFGTSVSQTTIAQWAINPLDGSYNHPNYLFDSPHSSYYKYGADEVLSHFGSISSTGVGSALSLSDLTSEISAGQPPMLGWSWDSGGGHAVVVHGTEGSTVYIRDPWPANGPTVQSYEWVCRPYGSGTWTQTLKVSGSSHNNEYATLYQRYMSYANYYYSRYNSTRSAADAYYCYRYYAMAGYYYYMYYGQSSNAASWYYYYTSNAYQFLANYYYSAYAYTGSHVYAAYCLYYYAYVYYYYYLYAGNSSYAAYYYNYYMSWAYYYYTH